MLAEELKDEVADGLAGPAVSDDELDDKDVLELEPEDEDDADLVNDPGIGLGDGVGMVGGRTRGGGLRPPGESSVAPNGTPTRPTDRGWPVASGDEADAPSRLGVVAVGAHGSEALLVLPPPSKSELAPPTMEQAVLLLFVGNGLRPGVASSVAPSGMPTGGTADPAPMPSGEVMPSGEAVAPTWANPAPQPSMSRKAAAIVVFTSIDLLSVLLRRDNGAVERACHTTLR